MHRWKPNVTVATILERDNERNEKEYLLVHEIRNGQLKYNQPAGHLDEGESLVNAAIRETTEETGWHVDITALVAIYRYIAPNGITYMRHAFAATPLKHDPTQDLDSGIVEAVWLSYQEIIDKQNEMHSPLVKQTIDDYLAGNRYPLALLHDPI